MSEQGVCALCHKVTTMPNCHWCGKQFCERHSYYKWHKCPSFKVERGSPLQSDLVQIKKKE